MKKMKMLKKQTSADNSLNIAVRAVMLGTVLGAVIWFYSAGFMRFYINVF